jgi:hypothetical protein
VLGVLDEIAVVARPAGNQFDLTFVARTEPLAPRETLLPLPTPTDTVEQLLAERSPKSPATAVAVVGRARRMNDADQLPRSGGQQPAAAVSTAG